MNDQKKHPTKHLRTTDPDGLTNPAEYPDEEHVHSPATSSSEVPDVELPRSPAPRRGDDERPFEERRDLNIQTGRDDELARIEQDQRAGQGDRT